jgi:hypothetical protein
LFSSDTKEHFIFLSTGWNGMERKIQSNYFFLHIKKDERGNNICILAYYTVTCLCDSVTNCGKGKNPYLHAIHLRDDIVFNINDKKEENFS